MKRLIAVLLLLVLATTFVACGDENDGGHEGMKNVAVENAAFYLYVPELWLSQSQGGVSGALSPKGNANVIATAYLPDTSYTMESYWTQKCVPEYKAVLKEFVEVTAEYKQTTLGVMNAYQYVFTHKIGENEFKQLQIIATDGTMIYTLQYTAPVGDAYSEWLNDVDIIRANFTQR